MCLFLRLFGPFLSGTVMILSLYSFWGFKEAVGERFGLDIATLMTILVGTSFHIPFYLSR